ncbi:hypothetical protein RLOatenuis_4760 [Rickettsiales bacterium]|nr:hypothetical protein RLOatenuis_4760 [Rickettsiales bacterium]
MCDDCAIIMNQEDTQKTVILEINKEELYHSDKMNADHNSTESMGMELRPGHETGEAELSIWHCINKVSWIGSSTSNSFFFQEKTVLVSEEEMEDAIQDLWKAVREEASAKLINEQVSNAKAISDTDTDTSGDTDMLGTPV